MSGANHQRVLPHLTQGDLDKIVDEFGRVHWFMRDGRRVCGRLKRVHNRAIEDEACLGVPMENGACRVHGGKSGGVLKHGRYSRSLGKWLDSFERARADKELIDSRRDIALMDVAIEQLLARAEDLDSPSWRVQVKLVVDELQDAIRKKRSSALPALLKELDSLVNSGAAIDQLVGDLVSHVDRRAARANKVAEIELKREEKITVSEVGVIFRLWLDAIRAETGEEVYLRLLPVLRRITVSRGIARMADDVAGEGHAVEDNDDVRDAATLSDGEVLDGDDA